MGFVLWSCLGVSLVVGRAVMASTNPFDLLGDNDNDDPSQLAAVAQPGKVATPKKAAPPPQKPAAPAAAAAAAKLPSKPLPPAQAGEVYRPSYDFLSLGAGFF